MNTDKRLCSKCSQEKELETFKKDKRRATGFAAVCKACDNARWDVWFQNNREKKRQQIREWLNRNPNKATEYWLRWAKEHPEAVERFAKIRNQRERSAAGGPFDRNRPDYLARWLMFGGRCAYCLVNEASTLDHMKPLSRGGSNHASNIRPACKKCNSTKGRKILYKEWVPKCLDI